MAPNAVVRPIFEPSPCAPTPPFAPLTLDAEGGTNHWLPLIECPANFSEIWAYEPLEVFEIAVSQLLHHPEYNSTLILRSETLYEYDSHFPNLVPRLNMFRPIRTVHRKLLPRRPSRDASLEQYCTFYATPDSTPCVLVLTPITHDALPLPYYHPAVSHLAFRYISSEPPVLRVEVLPLPGTATDLNSRLYRTCLALLDTLHRYCWGVITDYKKRVMHDCLVPRNTYQDLYLVMRERHRRLVDQWQEVTDPLKHVFEDIGIATFLMLLWKQSFGTSQDDASSTPPDEPWRTWGRPPGGFLDLGCGNGLLTHILITEGYDGVGIDLRARTSWGHYPASTQGCLRLHAVDPTTVSPLVDVPADDGYLKPGVFIIGNHADELTPWVPVLSTIYSASGYLSIPCCAWTFDVRYDRTSTPTFPVPTHDFADTLNLGEGGHGSSYSMYRIWLASLSYHCGWDVECEVLRIPSTRNWAIVGRKRRGTTVEEKAEYRRNAQVIIDNVRERGIFKTRKPEGKGGGDH